MAKPSHKLARVALVGRVNVGKSTLFNRLVGDRQALVSPIPGTTRDRREAEVIWRGEPFTLIDTGGVEVPGQVIAGTRDDFTSRITEQTEAALAGASAVVFVTSAIDGVLPQDKSWARALAGRYPTLLVVNKADTNAQADRAAEFFSLGLGEPHPVSAVSGRSTGDMLDALYALLATVPCETQTEAATKATPGINLAIIGQPNSGKSSLLNALLGEERFITSPKAHTTREPQDVTLVYFGQRLTLVDTAGIRRQYQQTRGIERMGITASLKTITRASVVFLMIDALKGPSFQDQRLASMVIEEGRGLVIIVNKWDLITPKTAATPKAFTTDFRQRLPGLDWAPLAFVSAKTKQRVRSLLDLAITVSKERQKWIDDATLQTFATKAVRQHKPARGGGVKHPRIIDFVQIGIEPPAFKLTIEGELHPSYLRFLKNRLRETYGFAGTPISILLKSEKVHGKKQKTL
ncbi:ribosome biogenesis GTPase Der [Candidatus Uhrbacteria bacterium CG10_big_fil_rev_8_21_14_0_10_48_11]|uniref:GTPase Der n=1 Tax=Candidatus Uhrbacteria bacterium CG10_big_fil_rev_8_21_14_0_10_48_11 TaxID=1975037 RepID=A0A2M8LF42_9BACT|nr:MAG: ribosome biogenesis GTPase Der [Candidatus Uhrbacteria bacterium CG10_big_fil_rev_8_21_14_0_10_48_11]